MTSPEFNPERIDEVSGQVADLQEDVNGINGRLGSLESQVADLQENVNGVNGRLSSLENQVADLQETANATNSRLSALEGQVAEVSKVLQAVVVTLTALDNKVTALDNKVTYQMGAQIDALNQAVDDLKARMLSMEQRITIFYVSTVGAMVAAIAAVVVNNILTRGG